MDSHNSRFRVPKTKVNNFGSHFRFHNDNTLALVTVLQQSLLH